MPAPCLYGRCAALQFRPALRHASIEIVLPADHVFLVAEDFFCGQPVVLCQRHKTQVQVGCRLIQMHHSGDDVLLADALFQERERPREILRHLRRVFLRELRADRHQRVHEFYTVLPDAAARHPDTVPDLLLVAPAWCHQMKVLRSAALVDVGVADVEILCPFVVGAQRLGRAALVFGKS